MKRKTKKLFVSVSISIFAWAFIVLAFQTDIPHNYLGTDFFKVLDNKAYDALLRNRTERPHTSNIVVVKIDESTLKEFEYPLPRDKFGMLLYILSSNGSKGVIVDYIFANQRTDSSSREQENLFLKFSKESENIFHAIGPFIPNVKPGQPLPGIDFDARKYLQKFSIPLDRNLKLKNIPRATYIDERPFDELLKISSGVGHVLMYPDSVDGIIRSVPFFVEYAGGLYPTFGAAMAIYNSNSKFDDVKISNTENGFEVKFDDKIIPLDENGMMNINFIQNNNFKEISFYDVLEAASLGETEKLSIFKNAIVVIGPTARSIGDLGPNPLYEKSPNCFVHANVYDQIESNQFITFPNKILMILIVLIFVLGISAPTAFTNLKFNLPISVIILFIYSFLVQWIFDNYGIVFSIPQVLIGSFLGYAGVISYVSVTEGKQKAEIKGMFSKYVDPSIVEKLIEDPTLMKLGGELKEVTILFSDIEGSTTIAEKLGPEKTVSLLNEYLTEMTNVILANKGTLDKYIGDAIMAFWNAPLVDDDHAFNACVTTLEMQRKLLSLHPSWSAQGRPLIFQRVGLNTGTAIVGNVGSQTKFNYTLVGDPVNLASRLEGANKEYGTRIGISEMTYNKCSDRIITRELDQIVVVGKTEPIKYYELIGLVGEKISDDILRFKEIFEKGIHNYKNRNFKNAISDFENSLTIKEKDKGAKLYIERCNLFLENPPPEDWNGAFKMTKKG